MRKGKYAAKRSGRSKRVLTALIALTAALCCAAGGTIAWLTSTPDAVSNTFTIGDITITLSDSEGGLKAETTNSIATTSGTATYVPGQVIKANPTVTVAKDSEACFLFIHIEEEHNTFGDDSQQVIQWSLKDLITNENESGVWTAVPNHAGYYYMSLTKVTKDTTYSLFTDSQLTVNADLTKSDIAEMKQDKYPGITVSAAAVQKENIPDSNNDNKVDVTDAWALLPDSFTGEDTGK